MKLVFQIAGGIVLASFILLMLLSSAVEYQTQQQLKEIKLIQAKRTLKNREIVRKNQLRQLQQAKKKAAISDIQWENSNFFNRLEQEEKNQQIIDDLIKKMN